MKIIRRIAAIAAVGLLILVLAAAAVAYYKTNGHPIKTVRALSRGQIPAGFFAANYGEAETVLRRGGFMGFITEKGDNYIVVKTLEGKEIRHVFKRSEQDYDDIITKEETFGNAKNKDISNEEMKSRFSMLKRNTFVMIHKVGFKEQIIICKDIVSE